jgi:hypothetical protein
MIGVGLRTPWSSGGLPSPVPEQPPEPAGGGNALLGAILGPPTAGTGFQSQPGQIDWNKVAASTQRHQQQPEPPPAQSQKLASATLRSPFIDSGNPFLASLYSL